MTVDVDLVLVAVDGSEDAVEAAEYAIQIAAQYGADMHLLHVLDQRRMHGVEVGDLTAETVADQQRAFTEQVRAKLPAAVTLSHSGAIGFSSTRLDQTPGSVILDVAEELDVDFLVVPRVTATDPGGVLDKAALHVLEYARQPVLSV
jgi:nucleotide-binding universal stress UspA family protein